MRIQPQIAGVPPARRPQCEYNRRLRECLWHEAIGLLYAKGDLTFMITADFHLHSSFSGDSDTPMEDMVREGIRRGLRTMCFTEHWDPDFPAVDVDFSLDMDAYRSRFLELREQYASKIDLLFGVEFGMQPHLADYFQSFRQSWPFDFIIGSTHLLDGQDPYYAESRQGMDDLQLYRRYFDLLLENAQAFRGFQVYGHLDYIVRYGMYTTQHYSYAAFREPIDELLKLLVDRGAGIELNTSGLKYGLGFAHPHPDILRRYRELGGEILTVGSDAHCPEHIAYGFPVVSDLLKSCGFRYYTVFRGQKPEFLPL